MSIWVNEEENEVIEQEQNIYEMVDNFFENIRGSKFLEYREGQHMMSSDIAEVIKNKEILLIEAGVGIGKSYAYLIPIFYAYKHDPKFHGFIISTSTIALQEQLERDIKKLEKMLDIEIPVTIAKGKTNYVCMKKLEYLTEKSDEYNKIRTRIEKGDIDRYDFSDLSEEEWKKINITSCSFDKCKHALTCPYLLSRKQFTESNAIICNHDLLIQHLKRESDEGILNNPSLLVIDEAHSLEDKIRNSCKRYLDKRHIENIVYNINKRLLNAYDSIEIEEEFFNMLNKIYSEIKNSATRNLRKNLEIDSGYEDMIRVSFKLTDNSKNMIEKLILYMENLLKKVEMYEYMTKDRIKASEIDELKETITIFKDLLKGKSSKNIYWVEFLGTEGKYIRIMHTPKDMQKVGTQLLSDKSYGKVITSATLTTDENDYNYYASNIGLDYIKGISILKEYSQKSPFDYKNNCLIYNATDLESPKNKEDYLIDISNRILDLLKITKGRSLILFTSKKDMQIVYDYICANITDFPMLIQENGREKEVMEEFLNVEQSSLFATGIFWEGIDINGASLSNVIITKLPFPVVEPVVESKASVYTDGFKEVYLKEMIIKLKQGVGRLIRSQNDTGVISILDSRMPIYNEKYDNIITKNLPDAPLTNNLDDVEAFANEKILKL